MANAGRSENRAREKYRLRRARLAAAPGDSETVFAEPVEDLSSTVAELEDKVGELTEENGQLRDLALRQKAEFDNFRRRVMKEKEQIRENAREDLLMQLLPVVDNFDRALEAAEATTDAAPLRKGVEMISGQLKRVLEGAGLSPIEALHKPFNPQEHEALALEERSDVPDNHVSTVMLPGYRFGEKVIRAAMVKVARAPHAESAGAPQPEATDEQPQEQTQESHQG